MSAVIRTYKLPCPTCGVPSLLETDAVGQVGIQCRDHGFFLIVRRPPTQMERLGEKKGARRRGALSLSDNELDQLLQELM